MKIIIAILLVTFTTQNISAQTDYIDIQLPEETEDNYTDSISRSFDEQYEETMQALNDHSKTVDSFFAIEQERLKTESRRLLKENEQIKNEILELEENSVKYEYEEDFITRNFTTLLIIFAVLAFCLTGLMLWLIFVPLIKQEK